MITYFIITHKITLELILVLKIANILSSSLKDNFKITTDASIEFVKIIDLRAITKLKNGQFDLDLEKINKNNFISDVIYVKVKFL